MRAVATIFLLSLSVSAVLGAYNDENLFLRNVNALLSFTQRTDLGNHIRSLPLCAEAIANTAGYFRKAFELLSQGGTSKLNESFHLMGDGLIYSPAVPKACGVIANETGETFSNFTSTLSKSPLSYIAIRLLNVAFRYKEIVQAWSEFQNSLPVNNSNEVGAALANVANIIFTTHPRLDAALGKFINPPASTGKGGGIINCLGLLDKTYLTLNRTWGDYKQNSRLEDLFNDFLIVGLEIPSTLKICAQALKNEGKKKKEDTILLAPAPTDDALLPKLIYKSKDSNSNKANNNESNGVHMSKAEFRKKVMEMFPLPPL